MPRPKPVNEKPCPRCKQVLPLDFFYSSDKYDGGYSPYCKPCTSEMNKKHRKPDKANAYAKKRYAESAEAREKAKAHSRASQLRGKANPAKWRAKKFFDVPREGVAPDVTKEYLEQLFRETTHCQCCGKLLTLRYEERTTREYRSNPNAPSVDRVNNRKGYTRNNIAIICWGCNYRKTDLTLEDLERMIIYIRRFGDV